MIGSGIGKSVSAPVSTDPAMNNPVITSLSLSLRRAIVAALLAVVLLPGEVRAAPEAGLRSFTAPPARDDDRPRPDKAPLVGVERRALPPPGAEALSSPAGDTKFTLACSAAEAAATSLTTPSLATPRQQNAGCPKPFIVIAEQP
jgi:hypothetical protein